MTRYIIPIFLMLISGGIAIFFVDGAYQDILALRTEQKAVEEDIARADKVDQDLARLRSEFESFPSGATDRLAVMLPGDVDKVKLLIDLEGVADRHGLFLRGPDVTISDAKNKSDNGVHVAETRTALLRFGVTAPYDVYREFLLDLERSLSIRDLTAVSLASGETPKGARPVYNFQIEAYTYFIK